MDPAKPLKKMILITPELLDKLRKTQNPPAFNPSIELRKLEYNIKRILKRKTNEETAERTLIELRKFMDPYLKLIAELKAPITLPLIEETQANEEFNDDQRKVKKRKKTKNKSLFLVKRKKIARKNIRDNKRISEESPQSASESSSEDDLEEKGLEKRSIEEDDEFIASGSVSPSKQRRRSDILSKRRTSVAQRRRNIDLEDFTERHFGKLASSYIAPFVKSPSITDKVYGIRREDDNFKIGDDNVRVADNDIYIRDKKYEGTSGLWELLTRKSVNMNRVDENDLKHYKEILMTTRAHVDKSGRIKRSKNEKYNSVIAKLFPAKWSSIK